jgi:hypothetical protein
MYIQRFTGSAPHTGELIRKRTSAGTLYASTLWLKPSLRMLANMLRTLDFIKKNIRSVQQLRLSYKIPKCERSIYISIFYCFTAAFFFFVEWNSF